MAHLHPIIFISSESSFQALQLHRSNFQYIYNLINYRLTKVIGQIFIKKQLDYTEKSDLYNVSIA